MIKKPKIPSLIIVASTLILFQMSAIANDQEVELITCLLKQNKDLIRELKCVYTVSGKGESQPSSNYTSEWLETPFAIRVSVRYQDGRKNDYCWHDGVKTSVAPSRHQKNPTGSIDAISREKILRKGISPWAQFHFVILKGSHEFLYDYLRSDDIRIQINQTDNKESSINVNVYKNQAKKMNIEFAKKFNMLQVKMIYYISECGKSRLEREMKNVKEIKPGIFLPYLVEQHLYLDSKLDEVFVTKFNQIQVNENIPADKLNLEIPQGTLMADQILGQIYEINKSDRDGKSNIRDLPLSKDQIDISQLNSNFSNKYFWYTIMTVLIFILCSLVIFYFRKTKSPI